MEIGEQIIISKVDFTAFMAQLTALKTDLKEIKKAIEADKVEAPTTWGNDWHSLKFVAEKLGIERTTITYWAKCGKIEKKKVGEKIFINIKEVHNLLNLKQNTAKVVPQLQRGKLKVG